MHADARYTLYGGTAIGLVLVALGALTEPVLANTGAGFAFAGLVLALAFDRFL